MLASQCLAAVSVFNVKLLGDAGKAMRYPKQT